MQKITDANKWIGLGCAAVLCIAGISAEQVEGATTSDLSWSAASAVESAVPAVSEPKIAVDPHGAIMAVWVQADSVTTHIYANRYVPGSGWGTAALLEASDLPADNPQIAADSNGNFIAVWIGAWKVSNGTRYGVHANRYTAGTGWGTASIVWVDVTKDYITADGDLKIATDPKGDAMAVWSVYDWSWNHTSVRGARYAAGTGWDADATNLSTEAVRMSYGPNVAMDNDGNAIAVWSQDSGTSITPGVMAVRYAAGTGWGTTVRIESAAAAAIRSGGGTQIAFDGQGNALAVWNSYSLPGIFSNRYVAGTGWGAPVAIPDTGATTYDEGISLAIDKNGNAMAVWNQYGGVLYASRYVLGAGWSTTGVIEANRIDYSAHVAFDQNGNAVAVWGNYACNSNNIQAIRYEVGTGWGYPARCYEAVPSFVNKTPDNSSDPQLVIDKNGIATAVWVQAGSIYSATTDMSVAARKSTENPGGGAEGFSVRRAAVRYSLAREGNVTISVFNLTGERLFTITDKVQSPGSYVAVLPLKDLGKGQYFVRCRIDGAMVVKKLVNAD